MKIPQILYEMLCIIVQAQNATVRHSDVMCDRFNIEYQSSKDFRAAEILGLVTVCW